MEIGDIEMSTYCHIHIGSSLLWTHLLLNNTVARQSEIFIEMTHIINCPYKRGVSTEETDQYAAVFLTIMFIKAILERSNVRAL